MEILNARHVELLLDNDGICALVGFEPQVGCCGFGLTVPEALRDLAAQLERGNITVWVPRKATYFVENRSVKSSCPECGHINDMQGFADVIAYICAGCGSAVELEIP
jgi:hypothetical protein